LGPFRLDTPNGVLLHGSEPIALGQRAVALLRALIEKPGALVSKDALIGAAWPGQAVEDNNLAVHIRALRRALGTAPGGYRWIETMPRRGYRFVGPLVAREENAVTAAPPQVGVPRAAAPVWHDEAERRQITALSCELLGVGAGAGCADLEDLRETIGDLRRRVSEIAARHEGVIYAQLGNNLLTLFGYPEAHEAITSKPMLIGYARVSTVDQNLALQRDALTEAGCAKIFTEQMSGAVTDRPALHLHNVLEFARSGDTLIVWKLDRLARSMKQLIETVETLRVRGIGFRSLTEALDTTTAQGRLVFTCLVR
jgi:DNA-binding winged helix-turn-helix (wHTH) protein